MTASEQESSPQPAFDHEMLKSLPDEQLVEALLDDARYTATLLDGAELTSIEDKLMATCWVMDEEAQAAHEEYKEDVDEALGRFSSAIASLALEEELEPEEATKELTRRSAGRSLALIEHHKQELEQGLETGVNDDNCPWNEGATQYLLRQICDTQAQTGIAYAGDYVRETALSHLMDSGYRGIVLLKNALGGDEDSYQPGIEALQLGIDEDNLDYGSAETGAELTMQLLKQANPQERIVLRNMSIDLLARMRQWTGIPGYPSYTTSYVLAAADLAVLLRNV